MMTRNQRFALSGAAIVLVVLVFLFGSAGMTAYAAQSALPGDALYPVKTGLEETRLALSNNEANRTRLHLSFAERRMNEIAGLIAEGRFMDIELASQEYELHVQEALASVAIVAQIDPATAAVLAGKITEALSRYNQVLSGMAAGVPASVQPQINRLMQASGEQVQMQGDEIEITGVVDEIGPDYYVIAGNKVLITSGSEIKDAIVVGDRVKVHVIRAADGSLTVREIELAGDLEDDGPGNENGNTNTNQNMNQNANQNMNQNANQNMNQNANQNMNQNTNQNMNQNANQNMNQNMNQNTNSNTNSNSNDNDDD